MIKAVLKLELDETVNKKLCQVLTNESGTKFSANVKKKGKITEISIQAKDMAGLQAAVNSCMEKIKIADRIDKTVK